MYNRNLEESNEVLRARIKRNMQTSAEYWQRELTDNVQRLETAEQLLEAAFNAICGGTINSDAEGSDIFEHISAAQRAIKAIRIKKQGQLNEWTSGNNVEKYTEQELQDTLNAEVL